MIENITPTERSKKTKLKMEDIKCKFYDEDVCRKHCDMTEEQLWEDVNLQNYDCDRENYIFYLDDDTDQYEYHKSNNCIKCKNRFVIGEMKFVSNNDKTIDSDNYICKECQNGTDDINMEYEDIICNRNIRERLDENIKSITDIRENICSLGNYRLHGRLTVIIQDLQRIIKDIELCSSTEGE